MGGGGGRFSLVFPQLVITYLVGLFHSEQTKTVVSLLKIPLECLDNIIHAVNARATTGFSPTGYYISCWFIPQ